MELTVEKTKGRKRHIVVDIMRNFLVVTVHAADTHDTKSVIWAAKQAVANYPPIKRFCADAGYQKIFENADLLSVLLYSLVAFANFQKLTRPLLFLLKLCALSLTVFSLLG